MILDFNLFNAFIAHLMLSLCFTSFYYVYSFHYALQVFTMFIASIMLYKLSLCL